MGEPDTDIPSLEPRNVDDNRVVKSDETLFAVVDYLQTADGPTLTEVAEGLGLSKGAVYKHLSTLKKHGFVTKDGDGYHLGLRFLEVGLREQRGRQLYDVAAPKIEEVAAETGKLTWCSIEENGLSVFLCGAEGDHAVNTDGLPGQRMHMHYHSGGKAMLAHMPTSEVEEVIDRYGLPAKTERTITDRDELFDELERIREQGYALAFEESLYGFHTVSAPVLTQSGRPVAAVIIAGAASRLDPELCRTELADVARGAANEISLDLEYE